MKKSYVQTESEATTRREPAYMAVVARFKLEFRKWYGSLSIKEIIENKQLIAEVEAFERLLSRQEVMS